MPLHRRSFLSLALAAATTTGPVRAQGAFPRRIACLDYALAETLLLLGLTPLAVMAAADWDTWVVEPKLPPSVADLGASQEPNLERLAALRPDLVLSTDYVAMAEPAVARIAPVERLTIYGAGPEPLLRSREITTILGRRLGLAREAEAALAGFDARLAALRAKLPPRTPPLLLVSFMDTRHVRVYGRASLYGNTLDQLGLTNAFAGEVNPWGFATLGIERLAEMGEARLVSFAPEPPDLNRVLPQSPLWTALPFVREGRISRLPAVLMFGALPSAARFAELLTRELAERAA
ncbi:ABC transporter substrate-binding protein [Aureimonas sp. ME7]|uniref:ABC transporter substrate-binding protein n=1 Tax=Aureimonas sp. ME7 TaxID=2744252 RepID=UPI0015F52B7C|nr:ABC transporter substrate-binding protein [Aureimonas sp. ME7]